MKSTTLLWRTAGITALLATLLFLFGFLYAVQSIMNPRAAGEAETVSPSTPPAGDVAAKDRIQLVALGDSLTKGYGDGSGDGYAGRVRKSLEQDSGKPVFLWNFAINGSRTDQLLASLVKENSEIPESVKKADIVLVTIGGNDLFQSSGISSGAGGNTDSLQLDMASLAKRLPEAADRLASIIARLTELNPRARIVYVSLYHPFLEFDTSKQGTQVVREWNNRAAAIAGKYANVTVVPTYDLFEINATKYLFSDHFHPNQDGYRRIAERVMQALD